MLVSRHSELVQRARNVAQIMVVRIGNGRHLPTNFWRKLYITRGSNIGYNIKEIKYFDTPRKAYEYIQETYGTSACIVENHL